MTGIDFVDTIVVRRTIEKGTKIVDEKIPPMSWAGKDFKAHEQKRMKQAGDRILASGKGTQKFQLSSMRQTQIPSTKGHGLVTGRGTGLRIGS